jgi:hypothetical protein
LGLSDSQFSQLINAADQLHPRDRDPFLRAVAHRFAGCSELGDGERTFAQGRVYEYALLVGPVFEL